MTAMSGVEGTERPSQRSPHELDRVTTGVERTGQSEEAVDQAVVAALLDGDAPVVDAAREELAGVEPFRAPEIEAALRALAERLELSPRKAFQPIRIAVTGSKISPGLFESLELLGKEESLKRLSAAAEAV